MGSTKEDHCTAAWFGAVQGSSEQWEEGVVSANCSSFVGACGLYMGFTRALCGLCPGFAMGITYLYGMSKGAGEGL